MVDILGFGQLGSRVKGWVLKGHSDIYWAIGKTSISFWVLMLIVLVYVNSFSTITCYQMLLRPHICNFFPTNVLLGSIFLHMKARIYGDVSTSHTCHMWRISDFSTSAMWRHLHMRRNFQFPHNCHTWKDEISPHDNFFSANIIRDICDKYQV